jgi:type II secretory pathway component PulJ
MGMHLVDLIVSIALSGLLLAGTFLLLRQGQQAYAIGAARVEVQQGVRLALERMAAEIRGAGFGSGGAPFAAIAVAEPARVTIQQDLNGDGVVSGRGETITYLLRGSTLRRDAGGGAQPLLDGVRELRLTYLDGGRRETTVPEAVRSIVISIAAEPARARLPTFPVVATAITEVRLRNR